MTLLLPELTDAEVAGLEMAHAAIPPEDLHSCLFKQTKLELFMANSAASLEDVQHLLTFMETEVMKECRRSKEGVFHLLAHHLHFYHDMLNIIMRDDAMPTPGSAHDLLNRWLGVPFGMTLVHTKDGQQEVRDCVVKIMLMPRVG